MTVSVQEIDLLHEVAARFSREAQRADVREYGSGNINKTYLVTPEGEVEAPFLLQRLNTVVFQQPELVMQNIGAITRHLDAQCASVGRRWEVPHVLLTNDGADHVRTPDGAYWRALRFIGRSRTVDVVRDPELAREVGFALGTFHALLSEHPPEGLADTLPGFHIAPAYLAHYDEVARGAVKPDSPEVDWCARFVAENRHWVPVLEQAREQGLLRLRPIHGDPKVNNILFDETTGQAIGMVDLDTVKPGLVQYDIGDCLRSSCNPHGEETDDWRAVHFDPVLGKAVLEGYLEVARGFFAPADFDYIPESARLIAFELGLRFFTDHLAGDVYFKVARPGQNLARALVQFRLAESIDAHFDELKAIV
ncbi:MAG TPA: aminoglycoside phosphotransferase family protein, partial [Oscillatoriaceae cyanobacterium]